VSGRYTQCRVRHDYAYAFRHVEQRLHGQLPDLHNVDQRARGPIQRLDGEDRRSVVATESLSTDEESNSLVAHELQHRRPGGHPTERAMLPARRRPNRRRGAGYSGRAPSWRSISGETLDVFEPAGRELSPWVLAALGGSGRLEGLTGKRRLPDWVPPLVTMRKRVRGRERRPVDLPWLHGHALVLTARAREALEGAFGDDVEYLPLACDDANSGSSMRCM